MYEKFHNLKQMMKYLTKFLKVALYVIPHYILIFLIDIMKIWY